MSQTISRPDIFVPPATQPNAEAAPPNRGGAFWRRIKNSIPTFVVVAALIGLAFWGQRSDWKLPKFSTLVGNGTTEVADWCEEHSVPESTCVACNPDLMPKEADYGWCAEHGVHNCALEHPDVAQTKETPIITAADLERAARALALRERKANNAACTFYKQRIQFASLEAVKKAAVDVELVERKAMSEWVVGNGEIAYDQTRLANISPRAAGTIWHVEKNIGDRVHAGEILAVVDSMVIGQAKSELVDALVEEDLQRKTIERLRGIGDGVVAGSKRLEAEAAYEKARVGVIRAQQALANLGLPVELEELRQLSYEEQATRLRQLGLDDFHQSHGRPQITTANLLPIRSPIDGVVVERRIVAGEVVETTTILFQVADTSRMWLTLNVRLEDASLLAVGQPVRFRPDGGGGEISGELSWISTSADPQTRMIEVRAELPNRDGSLRDETFGAGKIILRDEPEAIAVPNSAVHWEGCCHVVFVRNKHYFDSPESPKVFHVRSVRPGVKNDKLTEIIAGVLPNEVVATQGSDVLRAQLLKNSLGEGCCAGE